MAADNVLKAIIDVSAPGAKETFDDVAKATLKVNESLKTLGAQGALNTKSVADAIGKLKVIISQTSDPKDLQKLNIALNQLQSKAAELPPVYEKMQIGSLRASNAALNLTHTLGLMPAESSHITHGIESILFSFENLRAETGSTSEALKGLAGTIGSGLGIGLAITAINAIAEEFFNTEEGVNQAAIALENFTDRLQILDDGLKNFKSDKEFLNKIEAIKDELGGKKGPELDILNLRRGYESAKQYLELIKSAVGKTTSEMGEIQKKFQSTGFILPSTGVSKELVDKAISPYKEYFQEYNKLIEKRKSLLNEQAKTEQEIQLKSGESAIVYYKKSVKDRDDYDKEMKRQMDAWLKFVADYNKKRSEALAKGLSSDLSGAAALNKISLDISGVKFQIKAETDIDKLHSELEKNISERFKRQPLGIVTPVNVEMTTDEKELQKQFESFSKGINSSLKSAMTDLVASAGEAIGTALAGGSIKQALQGFVNIIGGALESIGKQLIAIGIAAQLTETALKFLFEHPALAIAAGIALEIAAGALRSSLSKGISGFAGGGILPGAGVPVLVGERGPEIFIPDTGGRIIPNHQISAGGVSGGGSGMNVQVSGYLMGRGNDLVAIIESAKRSNNRLV
jgi:hypothetical protein